MPWCPECRMEYRDGLDTCTECGAAIAQDPRPQSQVRGVRHPVAEAVIRVLTFLVLASATSIVVFISYPTMVLAALLLGQSRSGLLCLYTLPALPFLAIGYGGRRWLSPAWIWAGSAPLAACSAYGLRDASYWPHLVTLPVTCLASITSGIMFGRTHRWAYLVLPVAAFLLTSLVLHLLFFR